MSTLSCRVALVMNMVVGSLPLFNGDGVHVVVLPASIDLQVSLRDALEPETGLLQNLHGCLVVKQGSRLDPMKPDRAERQYQSQPDRLGCVASPSSVLVDPITQRRVLPRPASNVPKNDVADERFVVMHEDPEHVPLVTLPFEVAALDLALLPFDGEEEPALTREERSERLLITNTQVEERGSVRTPERSDVYEGSFDLHASVLPDGQTAGESASRARRRPSSASGGTVTLCFPPGRPRSGRMSPW